MTCTKHRRCYPHCGKPRMDGTYNRSLASVCLLCWNTGCRIPVSEKLTIDEWIALHGAEERVPPKIDGKEQSR